jgi:hypothetical protein
MACLRPLVLLHSKDGLLALPANIRLAWKGPIVKYEKKFTKVMSSLRSYKVFNNAAKGVYGIFLSKMCQNICPWQPFSTHLQFRK